MENEKQITQLKKIVQNIQLQLDDAKKLLFSEHISDADLQKMAREKGTASESDMGRVIEGVFDGLKMIGPDGKQYMVPANYASKSKLVEGDMLKLTITDNGSFLFKQIGPVERDRVIAQLDFDGETQQYLARTESATYKLLSAPVTYFKGEPGDEVIVLVPKDTASTWAAVENIVKKIASQTIKTPSK